MFVAMGVAGGAGSYLIGALVLHVLLNIFPAGIGLGFHLWQWTLFVVGGPGLILATAFALIAREPARSQGVGAAPSFLTVLAYAAERRALYVGLFGGAACLYLINAAFVAWAPEFMTRRFGLSIENAGVAIGLTTLAANAGGALLIPVVTAILSRRFGQGALSIACIAAAICGSAAKGAAGLAPSPLGYLVLVSIGGFFLQGAINNVIVSLQKLAPGRMRGTLVAFCFAFMTLVGLGGGPPLVALLGQHLAPANALGSALAYSTWVAGAIGVAFFLWSLGSLRARVPAAAD